MTRVNPFMQLLQNPTGRGVDLSDDHLFGRGISPRQVFERADQRVRR